MFQVGVEWNPLHARLKELILKKECFKEMQQHLLYMHSLLHTSEVYHTNTPNFMEEIWDDLDDSAFRRMPTIKDDTIAWNIWHITRIEDLTVNLLIHNGRQVLDDEWLQKLETTVKDTGNAMSDEEIIHFSNRINKDGLYDYRNSVGKRTREIIEGLEPEDLKRKADPEGLARIFAEGGLINHPDSIWLSDFWGRKNVAGLILMPVTRHQIVHLNDCARLKKICNKRK